MDHLWRNEVLFISGNDFLNSILSDLSTAKISVHLEFYIFEYDNVGKEILNALRQCVQRGLTVKLIVDGVGSFFSIEEIENFCRENNIEFKIFNKIPFSNKILSYLNIKSHWSLINKFSLFNRRTHRKLVVVDNQIAYVGSRNITDVHYEKYCLKNTWLDVSVKVEGEGVAKLNRSFEKIWWSRTAFLNNKSRRLQLTINRIHLLNKYPVRLNFSLAMRLYFWWDTNKRIKEAKERVWIMNAYFVPHKTILNALKYSVNKNVDVRLCLPSKTDVPVVRWATLIFYKILLKNRIRIFEYDKSVLHTKLMIIDDYAIVGSHNLNYRSVLHDLECEVILRNKNTLSSLNKFWNDTILQSHEITFNKNLNIWKGLSIFDFIKGRLALLIRYYI